MEEEPEPIITVFDDPKFYNVVHPLQHSWTMWFDYQNRKSTLSNWAQTLKNLITFDSIEGFWGTYNNLKTPSQVLVGSTYHMFKHGIRPEWEDPMNANGGKWVITFQKTKKNDLDKRWMYTLLACIGNQFADDDIICGVVVSVRKHAERIALWTKSDEIDTVSRIRDEWVHILGCEKDDFVFQIHASV